MFFWWLAASGCSGGEVARGGEFTLHIDPVLAFNQRGLFEELSDLSVVLQKPDGTMESYDLGEPISGTTPSEDGVPVIEDSVVTLEGYAEQALRAWGRSAPVTLETGTMEVATFVGGVGDFAWLDPLEVDVYGAPVVALGQGRFLAAGGATSTAISTTAAGLTRAASEITAVLDLLDPSQGLGFRDIEAQLPTYEELGVVGEEQRGRYGHTLTALEDGRVILAGGGRTPPISAGSSSTRSLEIWDPVSGQWSSDDRLDYARSGHLAIVNDNGRLLFWGGLAPEYSDTQHMLQSAVFNPMVIEAFDPITDAVDTLEVPSTVAPGSLGVAAANFSSGGGTLVCGGAIFGTVDTDGDGRDDAPGWKTTDQCMRVGLSGTDVEADDTMERTLAGHAMVTLADGRVLLTGGAPQEEWVPVLEFINEYYAEMPAVAEAWIYNPEAVAANRWSTALPDSMNYARAGHQMYLLDDGRVLIVGGASTWSGSLLPLGERVKCAEIFDPSENSFTVVAECDAETDTGLEQGGSGVSLAIDPDYGALVAGGTAPDDEWVSTPALYTAR